MRTKRKQKQDSSLDCLKAKKKSKLLKPPWY